MWINFVRFCSIFFTALSLAPGLAHTFELVNKMKLSSNDYLTVQQIYRGWALLGVLVLLTLLSNLVLIIISYRQGQSFTLQLIAFISLAITQLIFWVFTYPVNHVTKNWTTLPANWILLRNKWEFSHAASSLFTLFALILLIISSLPKYK
jgi:hypothetical protein